MLAPVTAVLARQILITRPQLRTVTMPFQLQGAELNLLWLRVNEDDLVTRFTRKLLQGVGEKLGSRRPSKTKRK